MHAPAYHCPACGGPQRHHGPGNCDFCGAVRVPLGVPDPRSATPCPSCTQLVSAGSRFCPRCGAAQGDAAAPLTGVALSCPSCADTMAAWPLDPRLTGTTYRGTDPIVHGCSGCGGAWVDRATLDAIIREARAAARGLDPNRVPRRTMHMADAVVYRPCPRCKQRMNRRNFGRYSGIVVDQCQDCGTFFDAGELEGVVEFVRAGGLALTERRDAEEDQRDAEHRRKMNALAARGGTTEASPTGMSGFGEFGPFGEPGYVIVVEFVRWLGQWIRRITR